MTIYKFGEQTAKNVLIQPISEHDLSLMENEVNILQTMSKEKFCLIAVKIADWNKELSPWEAPAVFGNQPFGNGAKETLEKITTLCTDREKSYFIGGYSLAGLFSIWAAYKTDVFSGVAAASPSIWFPGFYDFMRNNLIKCPKVYLSLGDKEEKTNNKVMSAVGDYARCGVEVLKSRGVESILEWNEGNHFKDADLRTAKAFAWVLNTSDN